MQRNWKNWCRLCGTDNQINIDVFIKNENFSSLSEAIQKFFSIAINPFDETPTKICQTCYDFMINLLDFSVRCTKMQEMYAELQFNCKFDMISNFDILREKYGLLNNKTDDNKEFNNKSTRKSNDDNDSNFNGKRKKRITRSQSIKEQKQNNIKYGRNKIESNNNNILDEIVETSTIDPLNIQQNINIKNIGNQTNEIIKENSEDFENDFVDDFIQSDDKLFDDKLYGNSNDIELNVLEITDDISTKHIEEKSIDKNDNENDIKINRNNKNHDTKIKCEKCPKIFTLMARYLIHLKNKHSIIREPPKKKKQDIIMNCKVCKKGFSNRGSYHLHLKIKHSIIEGPVIHTCKECNKNFKTSGALTSHKRIHQKLEERIFFPCSICNKKFSSEYTCETHIKTRHNGEKPFVCDQCGKTLTSKRSLYFHQFVHTESESLQCEICSKIFTNQLRLSVHLKTHSQIAVNCPVCNLTLKNKTFLNHHMITHSDEKQFKCTYCGNEFKRKKNLRTHMIIHTGLKPYECPFCTQSFANRSNCKKHQKHSHPEESAVLEASGKEHYSKNIPKLHQLQAMLDQMAANQQQ